ncbi:uncharacterized protein ATNIH1004_011634 [Aspergillus tanneri]|uniref:Uncharacterized protein n=1 Tax=Aspergillus tanneri TaxID=1220188 RepID=A0A5M9M420_9EURO|nr:uncharacterized protein ATNIH1004_011634 [Aspergillus tanneri]KAA8641498.1 hypothetical protein ATNIH1004_011634 [Aspergillus tanneri]
MRDIRAKRNDNPLLPTRERRSQGTTTRGVLSPLANIAKLTNDVATIASTNKVLPEQLKHATEEAERRATDFGIREAITALREQLILSGKLLNPQRKQGQQRANEQARANIPNQSLELMEVSGLLRV